MEVDRSLGLEESVRYKGLPSSCLTFPFFPSLLVLHKPPSVESRGVSSVLSPPLHLPCHRCARRRRHLSLSLLLSLFPLRFCDPPLLFATSFSKNSLSKRVPKPLDLLLLVSPGRVCFPAAHVSRCLLSPVGSLSLSPRCMCSTELLVYPSPRWFSFSTMSATKKSSSQSQYTPEDLSRARQAFGLLIEVSNLLFAEGSGEGGGGGGGSSRSPSSSSPGPSPQLLLLLTRLCEEGWNPLFLARVIYACQMEKAAFLSELD